MKTREVVACLALSAAVLTIATPAGADPAGVPATGRVGGDAISFRQRLQPIDGLGFASPFQRSTLIRGDRGLSPQSTREILDLLFDRRTGAGSAILRIGIGSSTDDV